MRVVTLPKRHTYSILAIARRHPVLFLRMFQLNRINAPAVYADTQNEMNRSF